MSLREDYTKYQVDYLKTKHQNLNTSDQILSDWVKKATGKDILSKTKITTGEMNEVYSVKLDSGGDVIVRVSHKTVSRFEAEKWAIEQCALQNVPVPKVLLIDTINKGSEKLTVCIEYKLPGDLISELYLNGQLSRQELEPSFKEAGVILSKIHSIKTSKFGKINSEGVGELDRWKDYILWPLKIRERLLNAAANVGLEGSLINSVTQRLESEFWKCGDTEPRLLHGDYGAKNILTENGKITGVLDFEECLSGDPVFDIARFDFSHRDIVPLEWLLSGYNGGAIVSDIEQKINYYQLYFALTQLNYHEKQGSKFGIEQVKRRFADLTK